MTLADVRFEEAGESLVAHLTGEIDLSNAASLGRAIHDEVTNHTFVLVLDLSDVEYLESAGIQLIYQLGGDLRVRGQMMRLVLPTQSPAGDTLRLTGLDGQLDVFETVAAALQPKT